MPTLKPGYAYCSTRRNPKLPDTVVVGESEVEIARYVGTFEFEDQVFHRFRVGNRYYFQLRHMSFTTTKG